MPLGQEHQQARNISSLPPALADASSAATPEPSQPDATSKVLAVTQLSSAGDTWSDGATDVGGKFNGMYTKLVVTVSGLAAAPAKGGADGQGSSANGSPDNVEYLRYEPRNGFMRWVAGYDFSLTLTAKLHVKDSVDLTAPLAIIGHESNSDGETWLREIDMSRRDFPLFLYRSDGTSIPNLTLEVKGAKSVASKGAAAAVSAITGIARVSGADPAVITTLTQASTKAATQEVDNALSKIFSSSVTERFVSDSDLKRWTTQGSAPRDSVQALKGLSVSLFYPDSEANWNVTQQRKPIGTWTLTFANPRPSIFYEWSVCETKTDDAKNRCSKDAVDAKKQVVANVTPADILHFKLVPTASGLGQIDSYVRQQKWFNDASVALAKADTATPAAKDMFCQTLVDSMTSLGLNEFDGQLVLWAVDTGMPTGLPELNDANSPRCNKFLTAISKLGGDVPAAIAKAQAAPAPAAAAAAPKGAVAVAKPGGK